MKRVELVGLKLRNFKGIKEFEIKAAGKDLTIKGTNASGKTTLFDGFTFLLWGKDSKDKTDFKIKPLDKDGNVKQHGLDHEVEGIFRVVDPDKDVDKTVELKRVFAEKWTKSRGSSKKQFTGHTTTYYVDGVPVKQKEYDETVGNIVNESVFKLLANPLYFNMQMSWQDRRKILLEISGDVTDQEVAEYSKNKDLKAFIESLNGKTIEDMQKIINAKRKEINQELDKIPVRIDELNFSMPDLSNLDKEDLQQDLQVIERQIESNREKIAEIKNGAAVMDKKRELSEIELELTNIRNSHDQEGRKRLSDLQSEIYDTTSRVRTLESDIKNKQQRIEFNGSRIFEIEQIVENLRDEWTEVDAETFEHNQDCNCPTCGQELPAEQLESAREKAENDFNIKKAERLEIIVQKGNNQKEKIESLTAENEKLAKEILTIESEIAELQTKYKSLQAEESELKNNISDVTENPQYVAKINDRKAIEEEIIRLKESVQDSVAIHEEKIASLENQKKEIQGNLNKFELASKSEARIRELEDKEEELNKAYEQLEKDLFLSEEFTRKKVDLLEEKINSKFKLAEFKLFEEQINGGLKEMCVTTYQGVPFDKGLNTASQINIGLDIIETLQQHYGIRVPIWIDNRESVVALADIDSQIISLVVSEQHQVLTIEEEKEKATA